MRKAASRQDTMFTVKMYGRQSISAAAPTIWRNICGGKDILPTLRESIGRYDCHSTSILQGLIRWTKDGRPTYPKDNGRIRFFRKPQGNHQLSSPNAAGFTGLVSAFSKDEPHLQTVPPLLLSVRRSAEEHGI